MSVTDKKDGKQLYEKPRLRVIELAADEVLVIGCKTFSGGGAQPPAVPCNASNCSTLGS